MVGTGSINDPFRTDTPYGYRYAFGRVQRDPRLNSGEVTKAFITHGQSLIASSENALYTATNASKIDNLNVFDGGMYAGVNPLLGCDIKSVGGNWQLRLADKLIDAGYCARVILVPIAIGSMSSFDLSPTGVMYASLVAAFKRLGALSIPVSACLLADGEQDNLIGTSQANYQANIGAMISAVRAIGFNAPWLVGKSTRLGSGVTSSAIRAAVDALVNGTTIFAGADHDTLDGTYRWDTQHFNATGADAVATLWKDKVVAAGI